MVEQTARKLAEELINSEYGQAFKVASISSSMRVGNARHLTLCLTSHRFSADRGLT